MSADFILGIDCGATKSAGVLCDLTGRILAWRRAGGCCIQQTLSPAARAELSGLVRDLCDQASISQPAVRYCAIGMNGIDFEEELRTQLAEVAKAVNLPVRRLGLVNDGIVALWGLTPASAAAILQHGTGVTAAWRRRPGGETLFDHLNSGKLFDMRSAALAMVARMIDGRKEATRLKDGLLSHLGIADERKFSEAVWRGRIPRARLLGTPVLIFQAWQEEDPAAEQLVRSAMEDYALTAYALGVKTRSKTPHIGFGGGVIRQAPPQFWNLLRERVQSFMPGAVIAPPELQPELGAAVMAAFRLGCRPGAFFLKLVKQSKESEVCPAVRNHRAG
jgi:N-acetylglucosamine kinase-like BadF-type ATPase